MEHAILYASLATLFGFIMAWGVGANDVANAMGTSVGSKAITVAQAVIIASIFEALGALLAGGEVTSTISSGIINSSLLSGNAPVLIQGMLASLLASGSWLLLASYFGWPVSTTHSIIGAIIGFGVLVLGINAVYWIQVGYIALSWVATPILAGIIAFALFRSVQLLIFNAKEPIASARLFIPVYVFIATMVVSLVTIIRGLDHVGFNLSVKRSIGLSLLISVIIALVSAMLIGRLNINRKSSRRNYLDVAILEKIFGVLMAVTGCAMAFAHGSNDVANAIGPLAAVIGIIQQGGVVSAEVTIPLWILLLGAVGIVLGLAIHGHRVMATVGTEITQLTPSRGFAAQLATASTVILASGLGLPVSTTQTLVGAVLGIGFARGMGALNLTVVRNIFLSWLITLPIGALLAIGYYYILHGLFTYAL
jgi:PiT family inorganic phosphate transporter